MEGGEDGLHLNFSARPPLSVQTKEAPRVREDDKGLNFRSVGGR